jgi:hypothetical protein
VISLGARYLDYGLTGGFFLFVGMALFGWLYPAAAHTMVDAFWKILPAGEAKALETSLNGIFASLVIVCVFATGLLLDLAGSLLILLEADVFVKHLKRNEAWVGPLLAKYEEFLGEDMNQFLAYPNFWKRLDPRQGLRPYRLMAPFGRIESILLSHLLLTADSTKLDMVMDQARTCRIARAVSSGLYILVGAFFYTAPFGGHDAFELSVLAIALGGPLLSTFIVRRAYSKFCSNLFSHLFVLSRASPA